MFTRFNHFVAFRPMLGVTLFFILGILIQASLRINPVVLIIGLSGLGILSSKWPGGSAYILAGLIILAGCLRMALDQALPESHLSKLNLDDQVSYLVKAKVMEIGETARGTAKYRLQPVFIGEQPVSAGELLLYAREGIADLQLDDTLAARMQLSRPRPRRNPHEFDYREYLHSQNIFFEAFFEKQPGYRIYHAHSASPRKRLNDLRSHLQAHFKAHLSNRSAAIVTALILGEKRDIESSIREDFANTGVIHVLAVSGLHVGYVSMILLTVLGLLRLGHTASLCGVVLGLGFYVVLTGSAPSVMRASIMASLIIIGQLIERKTDIFNTLASAALFILLLSPDQLWNIGFQLSFLAVLSIVTLFPEFKLMASALYPQNGTWHGRAGSAVLDLFLVSLAAQLGTLGLTIFYFHKIPIISLAANLVVVPLVGLIVATGMTYLILGMLIPFLAPFWGATLEGLIDLMLWFVKLSAQVDWAFISTADITPVELLIIMLMIFALPVFPVSRLAPFWLAMILVWSNVQIWSDLKREALLEMVILDVGQGDAILIHTPQGKTVLIDAGLRFGGKDMGKDVIDPYLRSRGWETIDLMVLTHPHNDHIGGVQYLLENHVVRQVMMPDVNYESFGYGQIRETMRDLDIPMATGFAGQVDSSLKPLFFRVTAPKFYELPAQPSNINNTSIVIQTFYGNTSALLTGDAEVEVESDQLPFGNLLKAEVLKVPHHGSKTSSSQAYLDLIQADLSVMSVGTKNKFRHPAAITLQRYERQGSQVLRTDVSGAVILHSDGSMWKVDDWRGK